MKQLTTTKLGKELQAWAELCEYIFVNRYPALRELPLFIPCSRKVLAGRLWDMQYHENFMRRSDPDTNHLTRAAPE